MYQVANQLCSYNSFDSSAQILQQTAGGDRYNYQAKEINAQLCISQARARTCACTPWLEQPSGWDQWLAPGTCPARPYALPLQAATPRQKGLCVALPAQAQGGLFHAPNHHQAPEAGQL